MRKVLPILTVFLFAVALFLPLSSPQPVEGQTATEALTTDNDAKTDDLFNGFGARGDVSKLPRLSGLRRLDRGVGRGRGQ